MSASFNKLVAVPTNVITGFLGVGKTSAILHLLKTKPKDENWAVLVNEFGEIGVDGSLFSGQHAEQQGIYVREVPGGCMCCAAGLPMQIALNQLLTKAKPDRLLIEPTGLGHPREVLQVLASEHYLDVLELHKVVTLVDARKLSDERYLGHETFNQQLAIADLIAGNKIDLYQNDEKSDLETYKQFVNPDAELIYVQDGLISPELLYGKTRAQVGQAHHHHSPNTAELVSEEALPACGYLKAENSGEGFNSIGWRIAPDKIFDRERVLSLLRSLKVERAKGVFITYDGIFAYNLSSDSVKEIELDDCLESRIEVIGRGDDLLSENALWACLENQ
jgi:G3E family GTPase